MVSIIFFIITIVIAIILLSFMTLKLKMHPVITLFITASIIGLLTGHTIVETMNLIKKYFGSTLTGIGILIIFGATIASGISDTGAATSIANFFIKFFKGKNLELAPTLTGFIMSIPVFGDIAIVLNAPISAILSKRKHISMAVMAPIINIGLTLTHGLVPPTPGILAVALALNADIGQVIIWGLLCSVVSLVVSYLCLKPIFKRGEYIEPLEGFTEGVIPVGEDSSIDDLLIKEDNIPSAFMAFLPLLLPAIMIATGSFAKLLFDEQSLTYHICETIGDSTIALFVGIIASAIMVYNRKAKVISKINEHGYNLPANASSLEIIFNNWIVRALAISIGPLMITAMGGAMGGILRENEAINMIGSIVAKSAFPKLLIPFILSAVLMAVCGSMTTASITAASLIAPMINSLGISPVTAALAIGSGSMVFWHVNNSGFWVFCSLYNFNSKQGLKYFTTANAFAGIIAFVTLCVLVFIGVL